MIPEEGYFNVVGSQWIIKGKVFNCRLKSDKDEILSGTVLFIENFPFHIGTPTCQEQGCACACHMHSHSPGESLIPGEGKFHNLFYFYDIFLLKIKPNYVILNR